MKKHFEILLAVNRSAGANYEEQQKKKISTKYHLERGQNKYTSQAGNFPASCDLHQLSSLVVRTKLTPDTKKISPSTPNVISILTLVGPAAVLTNIIAAYNNAPIPRTVRTAPKILLMFIN